MYFTQDEQPEPEVFNPCRYFHNRKRSAFVLFPILFPRLRNTNMSALTLRIEFLRTWVLVVMTMALILMWSTKWWCIEIAVNGLTICKVMFLWSWSSKSRIFLSAKRGNVHHHQHHFHHHYHHHHHHDHQHYHHVSPAVTNAKRVNAHQRTRGRRVTSASAELAMRAGSARLKVSYISGCFTFFLQI